MYDYKIVDTSIINIYDNHDHDNTEEIATECVITSNVHNFHGHILINEI